MTENYKEEQTKTAAIFSDYENTPSAPEKTPLGEVFNPTLQTVYNKNAPQQMRFSFEDEDAHFNLEFGIEKIEDEDLIEYDRLAPVKFTHQGTNQILTADDLTAASWFFDKNISLLSGFEGEIPADWREYFNLQQKQTVVAGFIGVDVHVESKPKFKQKFSFGASRAAPKITLVALFSGQEILCRHILPEDFQKHLKTFKTITTGLVNRKGQKGTFLPNVWKRLAALYDEMNVSFENYENEPPINHKALVMREAFDATLEAETKK